MEKKICTSLQACRDSSGTKTTNVMADFMPLFEVKQSALSDAELLSADTVKIKDVKTLCEKLL